MADGAEHLKKEASDIVDKLKKKATVSDVELEKLKQHIDLLESAAAPSHHHHDDSVKLE